VYLNASAAVIVAESLVAARSHPCSEHDSSGRRHGGAVGELEAGS
jgi:hypothetical protein